jgi:5-formyltetrahydrofolate cyclo-ligase
MNIEPDQKTLKSRLRKELRHRRGSIDAEQRAEWDRQINHHLIHQVLQSRPAVVAAYLAFDGEPDLSPSLAALSQQGVTLALPVIQDLPGKSAITFCPWQAEAPLQNNRYGIPEPTDAGIIPVPEIDLVLVPLVGWDLSGARLGMGASFYDRMFQPFAEQEKPARIGVAYELQKTDSIPCDPWDIPLHAVLTENGWFTFGD